jgi:heptosyltransferase-3
MAPKNISESLQTARNIFLIQLGDIGDVVWSTPALWAVKSACPKAKVSVLVREGFGSLLASDPTVHRIYEVKKGKGNLFKKFFGQMEFIRQLRRQHFDIALDLRLDERGAYMAFISGAPVRIRQYNPDVPYRLNKLFTHLVTPPPRPGKIRGAAEQSLCIVREMGIPTDNNIPALWVSETNRERALAILRHAGVKADTPWVSLNPFSRWSYKEWSYHKWSEVVDWLWNRYRIATVLVGAGWERRKAELLAEKIKATVFNLVGMTSLDELAAVLELSLLNIGVDSAAPHIAAAVGTPTITIYGPSDWEEWAPIGEIHRVILPSRDCTPCFKKGCEGKGVSHCLEELSAEEVKQGIQSALNNLDKRTGAIQNPVL